MGLPDSQDDKGRRRLGRAQRDCGAGVKRLHSIYPCSQLQYNRRAASGRLPAAGTPITRNDATSIVEKANAGPPGLAGDGVHDAWDAVLDSVPGTALTTAPSSQRWLGLVFAFVDANGVETAVVPTTIARPGR
jgi:hypothetical protein